jgi:hypothetical protein
MPDSSSIILGHTTQSRMLFCQQRRMPLARPSPCENQS